jgi:hypothetical protein
MKNLWIHVLFDARSVFRGQVQCIRLCAANRNLPCRSRTLGLQTGDQEEFRC